MFADASPTSALEHSSIAAIVIAKAIQYVIDTRVMLSIDIVVKCLKENCIHYIIESGAHKIKTAMTCKKI